MVRAGCGYIGRRKQRRSRPRARNNWRPWRRCRRRIEDVCASVIAIGKDQVSQGQELLTLGRGIQECLAQRRQDAEKDPQITQMSQITEGAPVTVIKARVAVPLAPAPAKRPAEKVTSAPPASPVALGAGARHLLQTLADAWPGKLTLKQWGTLAQREPSGGSFQENMRLLLEKNLVHRQNGYFRLGAAGCKLFNLDPSPAPKTTEEALKLWERALRPREMQILRRLAEIAPRGMTKEAIAKWLGLEVSGGGFQSYLLTLRQNDLIRQAGGTLHKNPNL